MNHIKQILCKAVLLACILLSTTATQTWAQDDVSQIVDQLREKYEEVQYTYNEVYCAKINNSWEFVDAKGKVLTNMGISEVIDKVSGLEITVNGKRYIAEKPVSNNQMLVNRYGRYAYMNLQGKLLTDFVLNEEGEDTYDKKESENIIKTNEIVEQLEDAFIVVDTTMTYGVEKCNKVIAQLSKHDPLLLSTDNAETLTACIYQVAKKYSDKLDKKAIASIYDALYKSPHSNDNTIKAIAGYRMQLADDMEDFKIVSEIVDRVGDEESHYVYAEMLANGRGCTQDIPQAIHYYQKAANDNMFPGSYAEAAKQALRTLWHNHGNAYNNPYGHLLTRYDDYILVPTFLVSDDRQYILVKKGWAIGLCDSTFNEVLPCKYNSIENMHHPLYVVRTENGMQLITQGGKTLTDDNYEDIKLYYSDETQQFTVLAQSGEKWSILDQQGKTIVPPLFDEIDVAYNFGSTFPIVKKGDKAYVIHRPFRNQRAIVVENEHYGLMDTNGKIVVPCKYTNIEDYQEGATTTKATQQDGRTINISLK